MIKHDDMSTIQLLRLAELKPWHHNARAHSHRQIRQIASSIRRFGFTLPVLIDEHNRVLAGHGKLLAAHNLALFEVPCLRIEHLSEIEKRSYVLADNKLALNSSWDEQSLAEELADLVAGDTSFDLGVTGFSTEEAERTITDTTMFSRGTKTENGSNTYADTTLTQQQITR